MIVEEYYGREKPEHVREEPWKVLVGCILSQRTKDEVTDSAYRRLMERYRSLEELASARPEEIEELIYPVGFYRQKARRIVEAAKYLLSLGGVPDTLEGLLKVPGIGRKCANIVLAYGFGKPAIAVDTHVERVAKRLGLVEPSADPARVEERLKEIVPVEEWVKVNHALVRFGREVCRPRGPLCGRCALREVCPSATRK